MHVAHPKIWPRQPVFDGIPQNFCGPLADECELPGMGIRLPDDGVEPLHNVVKALRHLRGIRSRRLLASQESEALFPRALALNGIPNGAPQQIAVDLSLDEV